MTEAPTILLIPGLLGDEGMWQAQRRAFEARRRRVVVADHAGLASIPEMARRALASVEGSLDVVGHSMGARVALEVVRQAPERVRRLALLDTGIHPLREGEVEKRQAMVDLADRKGMTALAEAWLPPMVAPERIGDPALMRHLRTIVQRFSADDHRRQIHALIERPAVQDLLPKIACPVLVMVGRQDQWSPVAQHEEIAALIPEAKLVVIEDCGHMSPVEQPEATTEALLAFLAPGE